MVEAVGVELFHSLLNLQLTHSTKSMKCRKCRSAGVIVHLSYTNAPETTLVSGSWSGCLAPKSRRRCATTVAARRSCKSFHADLFWVSAAAIVPPWELSSRCRLAFHDDGVIHDLCDPLISDGGISGDQMGIGRVIFVTISLLCSAIIM